MKGREMRDIVAEVRPAVDLARIVHEWDMLCGQEQRSVAEFKAAKTRLLIKARDAFNSRGDGFVEFVEKKLKTPFSTAHRWMIDAGWKPPKQEGAGRTANHSQSGNDSKANDDEREDGDTDEDSEDDDADEESMAATGSNGISSPESEIASALERLSKSASAFVSASGHLSGLLSKYGATAGGFGTTKIRLGVLQAQSQLSQCLSILKGDE